MPKSSIRDFVEQSLRENKGNRKAAAAALEQLIQDSAVSRQQIAASFVETVYYSLREVEEKKQSAKIAEQQLEASRQRHLYHKMVDDALQAIEKEARDLNDLDLSSYSVTTSGPAHDIVKKHFTEEVSKRARYDHRKKIPKIFESVQRSRDIENNYNKCMAELSANFRKAASFDRMVAALDAIKVGGKLLGDCTGTDLLREAAKLESIANETTAQAVFYRQLAEIVGRTTTVRAASDRVGIVGLLTSHYSEKDV